MGFTMSEERFKTLEKDIELMRQAHQPLCEKMAENTAAVTLLTHRVGDLVDGMKEGKEELVSLKKRVSILETDKAIRDSDKGWKTQLRNAVIGSLVVGSLGVLYFVLDLYVKSK